MLIAATFAAQGYIVVAPNYAGYDISTLGYHPFLNAAQQSGEMMDILAAARTALPTTMSSATSDNGQLFITGHSEGGHVAMATLRAMQAAGKTVTAAAPMSGPYALEAFGDTIFFGGVDIGLTEFAPLLVASYQHAYGNVDSSTNPPFSSFYPDAETLLPEHHADRHHFPGRPAARRPPCSTAPPRSSIFPASGAFRRAHRPARRAADAGVSGERPDTDLSARIRHSILDQQ